MSEPKSTTDAAPETTPAKPVSSTFPGYNETLRMLELSGDYLRSQGDLWNRAWLEIVQGRFNFKSWIAMAAESVDGQWRFARDLTRHAPPSNEAPPWVRLDWQRGKTAPSRISPPLNATFRGDSFSTDFCLLGEKGSTKGLPPPDVEPGPDNTLSVSIPPETPAPPVGLYISFVFPTGDGYAPILIVLLQVTADPKEVETQRQSQDA